MLAAYEYRAYKTGDDDGPQLEELIVSAHHDVAADVERAAVAAEAANAARDLQNAPANDLTPTAFAERAQALAGVQVDVWGRDEIVAAGMGAFAAVARGSDEEPRADHDPVRRAGPVRPRARLRRQGRHVRLRRASRSSPRRR